MGPGSPVAVMGVINVSPESFHAGSVYRGDEAVLRAALAMVEAGAALIDVGARSTAPYLATAIDEAEETARLAHAVELLAAKLPVPISADTPRPGPARAALEAGARVINDVSCLRDPALARLVAAHGASLILMAAPAAGRRDPSGLAVIVRARSRRPATPRRRSPVADGPSRCSRRDCGARARPASPRGASSSIPASASSATRRWRGRSGMLRVLAGLSALRTLGRPLAVGVSRKSFLGAMLDRADTADRLAGSLAATAIAVVHGAALIRTHDVAETRDAVRVAAAPAAGAAVSDLLVGVPVARRARHPAGRDRSSIACSRCSAAPAPCRSPSGWPCWPAPRWWRGRSALHEPGLAARPLLVVLGRGADRRLPAGAAPRAGLDRAGPGPAAPAGRQRRAGAGGGRARRAPATRWPAGASAR